MLLAKILNLQDHKGKGAAAVANSIQNPNSNREEEQNRYEMIEEYRVQIGEKKKLEGK